MPCMNEGSGPGRLAGWLASRQNMGKFQIFKLFAVCNKVTALLEQYKCI